MNITPYVINSFILIYILFAISWSIDGFFYGKHLIHKYLMSTICYLGLWHSWNMFSSPSQNNDSLSMELFFDDNSSQIIEIFATKNKKTFLGKKATVRDVKFVENLIYNTSFTEMVRLSFAKFLIQKFNKRVVKVTYIKHSENMKIWNVNTEITNKNEILQTINL